MTMPMMLTMTAMAMMLFFGVGWVMMDDDGAEDDVDADDAPSC
jgi:hypothetical protein